MINSDKKPLIGFFPGFFDIGEVYPLIKIIKRYQELGGEAILFSHGGKYEYLAKEQGFKIIRIKPIASGPDITRHFMKHSDEDIIRMIKNQALIYRDAEIKALVQTSSYLDCLLAPFVAKVPLISIISGTLAPPYNQANYATYPDNFESPLTQLVPKYIKNRINNWYTLNYKGPVTKKFNRIAKKIEIDTRFRCFQDLILGDYTLICDVAREHPNASLEKILTLVLNQQKALSEAGNRIAYTMQIKLGGVLFRMPGMRDDKVSSIMTSKGKNLKRNDRCLCGSGMKYKTCCLELKNYTEDIM